MKGYLFLQWGEPLTDLETWMRKDKALVLGTQIPSLVVTQCQLMSTQNASWTHKAGSLKGLD